MSQPGGKQANGLPSTSQSKPAADSGQNGEASLHPQGNGMKRKRGEDDHGGEPIGRGRSSKAVDKESKMKSAIAQIAEKGGIFDLNGVVKLIRLMQPVRTEIKMDMSSRLMLAGALAAADNSDCLRYFVQLRGLAVIDEWLDDIHKGKIRDESNTEEGEAAVEELLLVLLRVLDILPVDLPALRLCSIGKSVRNLRSHTNLEIQRKARGLIDTWKKRVEAEMTSNGATPAASSLGMVDQESLASLGLESHGVTLNIPQSTEERLDKSNQSHQSLSEKDDGEKAMEGSATPSKMWGSSTRSKRVSGSPRMSVNLNQKEKSSGRASSSQRVAALEKRTHSGLSGDRVLDGAVTEGNNHNELGVKNPNRVRSPAQSSGAAGYAEDSAGMSRQISPLMSVNSNQKEKSSARVSSSQKVAALEKRPHSGLSGDRVLEGAVTEGNNHNELTVKNPNRVSSPAQRSGAAGYAEDSVGMSRQISPPLLSDSQVQLDSASVDIVEVNLSNGCADGKAISQQDKDSRDVSSASPEDYVGMNLLASVAREMSRSDLASPTASSEMNKSTTEEVCVGDDHTIGAQRPTYNDADSNTKKQKGVHGEFEDGLNSSKQAKSAKRSEIPTKDMTSNANLEFGVSEEVNHAAIVADLSPRTAGTLSHGNGKMDFDLNRGFSAAIVADHSPHTAGTSSHGDAKRDFDLNHGFSSAIVADLSLHNAGTSSHGDGKRDFDLNVELSPDESTVGPAKMNVSDSSPSKPIRVPLDFDLNVTDEALVEEMNSYGPSSAVNSIAHGKQLAGGLPSGGFRRFDLGDGPRVGGAYEDLFWVNRQVNAGGASLPQLPPPAAGLQLNGPNLGSFSSRFPAGNANSTMAIPPTNSTMAIPPTWLDRGHHPFFYYQTPSADSPFTPPEAFRGPFSPSPPAVNFFPSTLWADFPVPSTTSSVGGAAPHGEPSSWLSQYQRRYEVNLPESSSDGRGRSRQGGRGRENGRLRDKQQPSGGGASRRL